MKFKTIALTAVMTPAVAMLGACSWMHHDTVDHPSSSAMVSSAGMDTSTMDSMSFADMDKNHDGNLSKDELPTNSMLYQHFSTADANGNKLLSQDEVNKHRADMAAGK